MVEVDVVRRPDGLDPTGELHGRGVRGDDRGDVGHGHRGGDRVVAGVDVHPAEAGEGALLRHQEVPAVTLPVPVQAEEAARSVRGGEDEADGRGPAPGHQDEVRDDLRLRGGRGGAGLLGEGGGGARGEGEHEGEGQTHGCLRGDRVRPS